MQEIVNMKDIFYRAYSGTSFYPEARAASCVSDFSAELAADIAELGPNHGHYKAKYLAHVSAWASRKSSCISTMIAGPANFNVGRAMKANKAEQKAWEDFRTWRAQYIKRAMAEPTKTPEEEIDDALAKLDKARELHEIMLAVNKIMRKKVSDEEKKELMRTELELQDATIEKLFTPNCFGDIGFAGFELSNSNARIKSLEQKVLTMKARIVARDTFEPIEFEGGRITVEADRVNIWHDAKPARDVIEELKGRGFRWAPSVGCWCRKHTANAVNDAKHICKVS